MNIIGLKLTLPVFREADKDIEIYIPYEWLQKRFTRSITYAPRSLCSSEEFSGSRSTTEQGFIEYSGNYGNRYITYGRVQGSAEELLSVLTLGSRAVKNRSGRPASSLSSFRCTSSLYNKSFQNILPLEHLSTIRVSYRSTTPMNPWFTLSFS